MARRPKNHTSKSLIYNWQPLSRTTSFPPTFSPESPPHPHPLGMVFKGLCSPLHAVRAYSTRQQFITVMKESHMLCSLQKDVIPVCEDVFEVRDYATTTFVFELGPQTNACSLARWGNCSVLVTIHRLSLYTTVRVVTNVQNTWQVKKKTVQLQVLG